MSSRSSHTNKENTPVLSSQARSTRVRPQTEKHKAIDAERANKAETQHRKKAAAALRAMQAEDEQTNFQYGLLPPESEDEGDEVMLLRKQPIQFTSQTVPQAP
ncbi:hypothetical protein HGRIS_005777 [Hohenbuehelia grisea]|uniref:Uncharacterized protein n=1 Tax=Hohenbuehelia grisea TaxID=104357 RepID=A0ABR3JXU3_9AGAR